ncbi:low temperature requirement protein A [Herbiconiux ginsengi]|uniref:Low temperature requirement protein LtrA n=1 Tax=Herbiconiux ginsengi TaxID=381665 RepID=A0A1H3L2D2_9MICO|nr:low temperature requirement protein A [Herbiconiux ginsengi]SDY58045.1 Low temperature requirement protein LtrA [Herbiconiux ginsengi]
MSDHSPAHPSARDGDPSGGTGRPAGTVLGSRLRRMTGRDPNERHRAATPLELLFDLAFVVAFSQAGGQLSHYLADARFGPAIGGFAFSMFAICWAWINFSWFASAYDTDDWFYRITTMVQMIGVVIVALGIPPLFHSLAEGHYIDNSILVAGYVVMRVAMVAQWLRAARQDPSRRRTALTYALFITIAQIGWVGTAIAHLTIAVAVPLSLLLFAVEVVGPYIAERRSGTDGTPWHAHHIAERYGLLTIIALGEGVFGTVTAVSAVVEEHDWTTEAALLVVAGIGLTFGLWWSYFLVPAGPILERYRRKSFVWGYGHMLVYASIAATGAGLHVAAYVIEGEAHIGTVGAVLAVAIPVLVLCLSIFALYDYLVEQIDPFHFWLMAGTAALLVLAVLAAVWGASLGVCLVLITLSPFVVVVGYETVGREHEAEVLARRLA